MIKLETELLCGFSRLFDVESKLLVTKGIRVFAGKATVGIEYRTKEESI